MRLRFLKPMNHTLRLGFLTTIVVSYGLLLSSYAILNHERNANAADSVILAFDSQEAAQQLAASYLSKQPAAEISISPLSLEQGLQIQQQFVSHLQPQLGEVIGYKAALTNQSAQERFGVKHPLWGMLLTRMLIPNHSVISANFGSRPMLEGDLMVRVGSEAINQAATRQEALAALDAVIPFVELPDLVYSSDVKVDAAHLQAINVGARLGVVGNAIPLAATKAWEQRLGNIDLTIIDETGRELGKGNSRVLLGHPLDVVLWLKNTLQEQGKPLKSGDLLSLGTITPLISVQSGTTIKARYNGLIPNSQENVEIAVNFD